MESKLRLFWDGNPIDLATDAPTTWLRDRVLVHTLDGTFSGAAVLKGNEILVSFRGRTFRFERTAASPSSDPASSGKITAPMPGMIVEVLANPGLRLKRGAKLAVLEAMKTQLPLTMPFDGIVDSVSVEVGTQVEQDATIAFVKPMQTA